MNLDKYKTYNHLPKLIEKHIFFIDTSALMDERAHIFFNKILKPHLSKNQKIYFHPIVYEELKHIIKKTEKVWKERKRLRAANKGKTIIDNFFSEGLMQDINEEKKDKRKDTDEYYLSLFTQFRTRKKLGLITQDKGLSTEIMKLNHSGATKNNIKGIKVLFIDHRSFGSRFIIPTPFKKSQRRHDLSKGVSLEQSIDSDIEQKIYDSDGYPYKLYKKIGEGGEGIIYDIKSNGSINKDELCCKIYHKDKLTDLKIAKLELMISNPLPNVVESYINENSQTPSPPFWSIAWPKKVLYNSKDEPVGYLMSKMRNTKPLSAMIGKTLIKKEFPSFKTIDLINVTLKVLEIIKNLHSYNVFIGDIQPDNFLIMRSLKGEIFICLVDVDSFQIERYPCPGGIPEFTHPDRQLIGYEQYLRTEKDECFAVSTLLFNIFMLKLFPYSNTEGGSAQKNMKERYFPYKLNGKVTEKALPLGKKVWPKLPKYLQEAFIEVFEHDNIIGIEDWINLMNRYMKDFERIQKRS
tara:strand:+ start:59 stop:1621 length:1563 start_codon:yes stop_codon:yes gene_type:complete